MGKLLTLQDYVNVGRNKKRLVGDVVTESGVIFNLIKKGLEFDDEVLKLAHITKTVGPKTTKIVLVEHDKTREIKYEKDTDSLKTVLKSLQTINSNVEEEEYQNNENEYNEALENY